MIENKTTIKPAKVNGIVNIPPSKSYSQRALLAAALSQNSTVHNVGNSNDEIAMVNCIKELGAQIVVVDKTTLIIKTITKKPTNLNVGESGLCSRLMIPVAAMFQHHVKVDAHGSLLIRPMDYIKNTFDELGVGIELDQNKFLPALIKGPYSANTANIDGTIGSQFLSGLLFALPLNNHNTTLIVNDLKSKPYVDITIETLREFGVEIENIDYKKFVVNGQQKFNQIEYTIEGDWSSASTLLVAAAIAGKITARNLNPNSLQADRAIIDVLQQIGAKITYNNTGKQSEITVEKDQLNHFDFDANDCPDLFPALVALAVNCNGISTIKGVKRLFNKESNRALTLQSEFGKLGAIIELDDDIMTVHPTVLKAGNVTSHNDHRIAMATAAAAVNAAGEITVDGCQAVNKSYPDFFNDLNKITDNE